MQVLRTLLRDVPVEKVKEFERDFLEMMNAKHKDTLNTLKSGKLTEESIDVITTVAADLSAKYKA